VNTLGVFQVPVENFLDRPGRLENA